LVWHPLFLDHEKEEHHEKDDSFAGSGRTDADRICGESLAYSEDDSDTWLDSALQQQFPDAI